VLIALLAYWVLQHITLTARQRYLIPVLTSIGGLGAAFLSIVTAFLPSLATKILPFYSGVTSPQDPTLVDPGAGSTDRSVYLTSYGKVVGTLLVAFRDPGYLLLFINPL